MCPDAIFGRVTSTCNQYSRAGGFDYTTYPLSHILLQVPIDPRELN